MSVPTANRWALRAVAGITATAMVILGGVHVALAEQATVTPPEFRPSSPGVAKDLDDGLIGDDYPVKELAGAKQKEWQEHLGKEEKKLGEQKEYLEKLEKQVTKFEEYLKKGMTTQEELQKVKIAVRNHKLVVARTEQNIENAKQRIKENSPEIIEPEIRQCGEFADWRVAVRAGLASGDVLDKKNNELRKVKNLTKSGSDATNMHRNYKAIGTAVDDVPAVGALATWEAGTDMGEFGSAPAPTGHAAFVARVYKISKADVKKANAIGLADKIDIAALSALVDQGREANDPVLYVLLEDYNGFGGELKYGQALFPAAKVGHFIHVATGPSIGKTAVADPSKAKTQADDVNALVGQWRRYDLEFEVLVPERRPEGSAVATAWRTATEKVDAAKRGVQADNFTTLKTDADTALATLHAELAKLQ